MLETVKIVRDVTPIEMDCGGYHQSLGAVIDEHIAKQVEAGIEMQSFTMHLAEEAWPQIARFYSGKE